MILLKAQMTSAPDQRARFLDAMHALTQTSRAESGCLSFACYEDVDAPGTFIVLQEWHDQASLDHHEASSHVAAFKMQSADAILSREPTRVFSISSVGGLSAKPQT